MKQIILALLLLAAAACGDDSGDDPHDQATAALERQMGYLSDGQYHRLYDELHPLQRDSIDKDRFVDCYNERLSGIEVDFGEVKETFEEEIDIPGTGETADSVAITAEVTVSAGGQSETDTDTFHAIEVDGDWTFVVDQPEDFESDDCGD